MNTPIADFVKRYQDASVSRLHMPGHKGVPFLGCEPLDITEVDGADDLYHAEGVIAESEANASALFGSRRTFYSAGGSSQCIKTMLHLAILHSGGTSRKIIAGRNAHKAFLHGCALLGLTPVWLQPEESDALCGCTVSPERLRDALRSLPEPPVAVYLTSPDYLGGTLDIGALAAAAGSVPLLIDNAHGAYRRFLTPSQHPLDLGAAMCCDSAHKTLPVLTGGSYLHIGKAAPKPYEDHARDSLALFGSSSPSYLILQSLDLCNRYLSDGYRDRLALCIARIDALKDTLTSMGIPVLKSEPLKITVAAHAIGTTGEELSALLRRHLVEAEYADGDFLVLMATPETDETAYQRIGAAFREVSPGAPRPVTPLPTPGTTVLSPREAMLSPRETIPLSQAAGRICADPAVSCPPAIPLVVSGELVTEEAVCYMESLGRTTLTVVRR